MKYTRIDIKSADDLPNTMGNYYVHKKQKSNWDLDSYYFASDRIPIWLEDIDWYLIEDTEPSYPESFLYWLVFEDHLYFPQEENGNNVWYDYERDCYKTLNDVYDVWLNEIKDK